MQLLWLFIASILLIRFRIRFFRQIFPRLDAKKANKRTSLLRGGALVALLFLYEKSFSRLGIEQVRSIRESLSWQSAVLFLSYVMVVVFGLILIFRHFKNKKIWLQTFVALFMLIGIAIWGRVFWWTTLVLYYLLAGSTEELFKFTVGRNQSESVQAPTPSTLLLFAILIGFSFSISENLLAFLLQFIGGKPITTGLLLGRGLLSSLIHIIATGSIALLMMKFKKKSLILRYALALILGFSIHICYNIALVFGWARLSVLLAMGGFFALSYLIFHLDEVYES